MKAAEVIRRLGEYRPAAQINDVWRAYVDALDLTPEQRAALVDPRRVWDACVELADPRLAKFAHACTHTTFSPNVVHGGVKTNVIPDDVVLEVGTGFHPDLTGRENVFLNGTILGMRRRDIARRFGERCPATRPRSNPAWS